MSGLPADRRKVAPAFWRAIECVGVRPAAPLRQARLPATLHLDAQALVTTAQDFAIWTAPEALTDDPGIGIKLVQATESTGHQPLFLAACHAADCLVRPEVIGAWAQDHRHFGPTIRETVGRAEPTSDETRPKLR
jgi:hypothetical protein